MLKNWLRNRRKNNTIKLKYDDESIAALNLKKALVSHDAWKEKLSKELNGHSEKPIDLIEVASDCKCSLGQWLHSTGKKKYSELPEYQKALKAHAQFHFSAAEVVIEHQSGNTQHAKKLLVTKFRTASNLNQLEIVRLFAVANL